MLFIFYSDRATRVKIWKPRPPGGGVKTIKPLPLHCLSETEQHLKLLWWWLLRIRFLCEVCVSEAHLLLCSEGVPGSVDRMDITKGSLDDISRPASSEIRRLSRDRPGSLEVLSPEVEKLLHRFLRASGDGESWLADVCLLKQVHSERTDLSAEERSDRGTLLFCLHLKIKGSSLDAFQLNLS